MVEFKRIDESTVNGAPVMFTRYEETPAPAQIDLSVANSAIRIPMAVCRHIYTVAAWGSNARGETNDFDTHNLFLDPAGNLTAQVQLVTDSRYQIKRGGEDVTERPFFYCSADEGIGGKQDRSATQVVDGKNRSFCNAEYSEIFMPAHDVVAIGLLDYSPGSDTFGEYSPIANILISPLDYDLLNLAKPIITKVENEGFISNLFGIAPKNQTINTLEPKNGEQRITVNFDNAGVQGNFMIFSLFIRTGDFVDIININKVYKDEKSAIAGVERMVREYRKA
jgi:hypothetical protein